MKIQRKLRDASKKAESYSRAVVRFLDSNWFLYAIIGLFVVQALWIAFSFRYPLIYDEIRHYPIIQIYASHISPFITDQPNTYDQYGSVNLATGTTASLYHYIMSFPYRLLDLFGDPSLSLRVIPLRIINILMAALGLVFYARIFWAVGIRRRYVSIGIFLYTMLPIVPFVAAHINYDNMAFLITPIFLLLVMRALYGNRKSLGDVLMIYMTALTVGLFAVAVKYTFLPILTITIVAVLVIEFRALKINDRINFSSARKSLYAAYSSYKKQLLIAAIPLVAMLSLVGSIQVRNLVLHGTPHPQCQKVLGEARCQASPIADRNMRAEQGAANRPLMSFTDYVFLWTKNMLLATNFSVSAVTAEGVGDQAKPLPIINTTVFVGVIIGVLAIAYSWGALSSRPGWIFLTIVAIFLVASVFLRNYEIYHSLHAAYATQPRYLLPIAPLLIIIGVASLSYVTSRIGLRYKVLLLFMAAILLTQGGGVITHIIRSKDSWYWDNQTVKSVNNSLRTAISPIVKEQ